jgi:tRNA 5-methylaminomethyl-2-thiouridine biosynthesis bifunctional protein
MLITNKTSSTSQVEWSHVEWSQGQPYASAFHDVYFSSDNGLLETEYVFLEGNQLSARWQNLKANTFSIAETGFGTGLNFLCAAKLWLETAPQEAVLHFISLEKYPVNIADLTCALQLWPELQEFSKPFLAAYENLLPTELLINKALTLNKVPPINKELPLNKIQDFNKIRSVMLFDKRIQLTLLIGDATDCLKTINLEKFSIKNSGSAAVDAWFLDGFSPAKNPEMWQSELFEQMAKLSNENTTFATFTSAGAVRRGLIAAGFAANKKIGFGKKREMLLGYFLNDNHITQK